MPLEEEKRTKEQSKAHSSPWYKKLWVAVSVLGFVCFTLIVNAPVLLLNLEKLPGDTTRVVDKFLGWYYDDEDWTGFWSSDPEGYVDIEDMELFGDVRLELNSLNCSSCDFN